MFLYNFRHIFRQKWFIEKLVILCHFENCFLLHKLIRIFNCFFRRAKLVDFDGESPNALSSKLKENDILKKSVFFKAIRFLCTI